jgi:hypothetical protein
MQQRWDIPQQTTQWPKEKGQITIYNTLHITTLLGKKGNTRGTLKWYEETMQRS